MLTKAILMAMTESASKLNAKKILKFQKARFPRIDVFKNAYPQREYLITITQPEYTALCPMTGLPDYGTITVEYVPGNVCIELKAFKYYLLAFRNLGVFYEMGVNKILDDLVRACKPRYMLVRGEFTARGGITTTVEAEYPDATASSVASFLKKPLVYQMIIGNVMLVLHVGMGQQAHVKTRLL